MTIDPHTQNNGLARTRDSARKSRIRIGYWLAAIVAGLGLWWLIFIGWRQLVG